MDIIDLDKLASEIARKHLLENVSFRELGKMYYTSPSTIHRRLTKWLADGRSLPPKPGDVWRIDCSRFEHFDRDGKPVETCAGWTWNRHGYYDSHIPETFTYVRFSKHSAPR